MSPVYKAVNNGIFISFHQQNQFLILGNFSHVFFIHDHQESHMEFLIQILNAFRFVDRTKTAFPAYIP